jgi:uncharacterized protein YndB with AHSA1/START domain
MGKSLIAKASTDINAPVSKVWKALIDPALIKRYFFGADVLTDWKVGSPIIYKGVYQGKAYEDKGKVLKVDPEKFLLVTHWSPLSGTADSPENYHKVSYSLEASGAGTQVTITQDNNDTKEEQEQNTKNWAMVLEGLKKMVEGRP